MSDDTKITQTDADGRIVWEGYPPWSKLEQLQAKRIKHLEAENQRLRDFVVKVADCTYYSQQLRERARAALDGTPSAAE